MEDSTSNFILLNGPLMKKSTFPILGKRPIGEDHLCFFIEYKHVNMEVLFFQVAHLFRLTCF